MDYKKAISVVLGTFNRFPFLKLAIQSIRKDILLLGLPCEIIVIDGGSTDGSLEWLVEQKDIILIVQHNRAIWKGKPLECRSWGYFMNLGFKCAQGKYVCMISDDCLLIPGALKNGYDDFEYALKQGKKVGALAFYWRHWPDDALYKVGIPMGSNIYVNHGMYLTSALREINFIEEDLFKFYFTDIDLCFSLWAAGYSSLDAQNSYVEHYRYAAIEVRKINEKKGEDDFKKFLNKWVKLLPQLTNHNVSILKTKSFNDSFQTSALFASLHEKAVVENPKIFAPPSLSTKIIQTAAWKMKMLGRKIKLLK